MEYIDHASGSCRLCDRPFFGDPAIRGPRGVAYCVGCAKKIARVVKSRSLVNRIIQFPRSLIRPARASNAQEN
jgi:hypothetical protein